MKIQDLAKEYFKYFKSKDIDRLKVLFDQKIKLSDWEVEVNGFKSVVEKNIEIFSALGNFDLLISNMYLIDNIIFAEIIITANNEKIKVLDKLEFSSEYKIKKITAYKG
tara:strand:+ start:71 stop:397 length:327 start_codon:yes stop_codon:yes gene_type:complete